MSADGIGIIEKRSSCRRGSESRQDLRRRIPHNDFNGISLGGKLNQTDSIGQCRRKKQQTENGGNRRKHSLSLTFAGCVFKDDCARFRNLTSRQKEYL